MKHRPTRKKGRRGGARRKLRGESIESRVLYSATWVGSQDDPDEADAGASEQGSAVDQLSNQSESPDDAALCQLGLDDEPLPASGGDAAAAADTGPTPVEPASTSTSTDGDGSAVPAPAIAPDGEEAAGESAPAWPRTEYVFVDANVPHADELIADITANAGEDRSFVIVRLEPDRDGIQQVSDALAQHGDVAAIHIISHGDDGLLSLGGTTLDQQALAERRDEIAQWGAAFTDDADILIYGCDVAGNAAGEQLIADLSRITGADVAASVDATGHESLGGDWELEQVAGDIETGLAVSEQFQSQWEALLPAYEQFTSFPDEDRLKATAPQGQTFQHTSGSGSYTVDRIELALRNQPGATGNVTVELRTSWSGTVLATATIPASTLSTTLEWVGFDFPEVTLTDGISYTIHLSTDDPSEKTWFGFDASGGYANGTRLAEGWPMTSADLAFRVIDTNAAPVANAGPDQTVAENSSVTLTAAGSSDPEARPLSYTWTQLSGPAVSLSSTSAVSPTFTAPELAANTTLTFRVAVSDGTLTTFDTVTITVNADDDSPTADAGRDQTVAENTLVTLDASGSSDAEGQELTYTWTQTGGPAVTLTDTTAARPMFATPQAAGNYTLTFEVAVSDGTTTAFDTVTINVNATDDAPLANAGPDQTIAENAVVTLDASGSWDPEGKPLAYTWTQTRGPAVTLSDPNAAQPTFTAPDAAGDYTLTFQVAVSDGTTTTFDTVTITVTANDDAPTADAGPDQTVAENAVVTLDASGTSDAEGQTLTFTWTQTGGPAVTLSDPSAVQPTFTAPEAAGSYTLTFQVAVNDGTSTTFDTVTITVTANNDVPVANAGPDQTVAENAVVTLDASGSSDVDGPALSFTWTQTSGPAVTLSSANAAQPTFTAPEAAGNYTLTFQVAVNDGTTTTFDTVTISVIANDDVPTANAGPDQTVAENTVVMLDASGSSDAEGKALSFSWMQTGGPAVMLSNANAVQPTFTAPEAAGNYTLTFQVGVNDGTTTTFDTVTITVNANDDFPTANAGPDRSVNENDVVTLDASGSSDSEGQALTHVWTQTGGPAVTLTGANTVMPTFTAPEAAGNYTLTFQVAVSDGTNTSVDTVTITVLSLNAAPVANAGTTVSVTAGDTVTLDGSLSFDAEASELSYRWTQISGPQLQLSGSNTVSPRVTVPDDASGNAIFELEVSDGLGTSTATVTVQIRAKAEPAQPPPTPPTPPTGGDPSPDDHGSAPTSPPWPGSSPSNDKPTTPADVDRTFDPDDEQPADGVVTSTAPRVSAGIDFTVPGGSHVQLSGAVDDLDDRDVRYRWIQVAGVPVDLNNAQQLAANFKAPSDLVADVVVTFQLTVTSGHGSASDTVDVTIRAGGGGDSEAPLLLSSAAAGEDVELSIPQPQFGPGETSVEWLQVAGTPVNLVDPNAPSTTFEAPNVFVGENLEFEVTTTSGSETHRQRVRIRIDPVEVVARHDMPLTSWTVGDEAAEQERSESQSLRGIGRLWAAAVVFLTGWFQRDKPGR